jgi:hypothetical protein
MSLGQARIDIHTRPTRRRVIQRVLAAPPGHAYLVDERTVTSGMRFDLTLVT